MCEELYVVYKLVTERVAEIKALGAYDHEADFMLREDVVRELEDVTSKMCRRAMIRNSFYMEWFFATVFDNALRYYVIPMLLVTMVIMVFV
jgi:hypothetical protein